MPSYKLSYFNGRGRAETSRMLFALADVEYEDHRFAEGEWNEVKPKTPFGQAPLLEVDGEVICQSHAIERFLAVRFGMAGESDIDKAHVDMIVDSIEEVAQSLLKVAHEKDEEKKADIQKKVEDETLPNQFGHLDKMLKANNDGNDFFVGNKITTADINFVNVLAWVSLVGLKSDPTAKFPKLKALVDRVNSDPKIDAWIKKRPETKF